VANAIKPANNMPANAMKPAMSPANTMKK
jgi:hypothetical protein